MHPVTPTTTFFMDPSSSHSRRQGAPVSDRHRCPRGPRNHKQPTRADDPPPWSAGLRPAPTAERRSKPHKAKPLQVAAAKGRQQTLRVRCHQFPRGADAPRRRRPPTAQKRGNGAPVSDRHRGPRGPRNRVSLYTLTERRTGTPAFTAHRPQNSRCPPKAVGLKRRPTPHTLWRRGSDPGFAGPPKCALQEVSGRSAAGKDSSLFSQAPNRGHSARMGPIPISSATKGPWTRLS